jgi:hypothetical protein
LCLLFAVKLAVPPAGRALAVERRVQSVGGELLPYAPHGHERAAQRLADPRVAPRVGSVGIGLEQDLGTTKHGGGMPAGANHVGQRLALFRRETDDDFMR